MKALKIVLGVVVGLIILVVGGSFLLPGHVRVERSTMIKAPPETIYETVGTLKTWKDWTAWNPTKYPEMKWEYKGPDSGKGAESSWTDPGGNGHMIITDADPKNGIVYDLTFADMPKIPGSIKFEPAGEETKVVWYFEQDTGMNPMNRIFCAFFIDSMVGSDFETGLAGLKKRVESEPATPMTIEPGPPPATETPAAEAPPTPAEQK